MEVWYFSPTCTPNLPVLSFCVVAYEHKENCYLYWPLYERTRWSKIRQCPGQFIGFNPNSCFSTWNWNQLIFSKDNKPISQILKSLTNTSVLLNKVKTQKQDPSFIWELGCSSELDCCTGGTQLLVAEYDEAHDTIQDVNSTPLCNNFITHLLFGDSYWLIDSEPISYHLEWSCIVITRKLQNNKGVIQIRWIL